MVKYDSPLPTCPFQTVLDSPSTSCATSSSSPFPFQPSLHLPTFTKPFSLSPSDISIECSYIPFYSSRFKPRWVEKGLKVHVWLYTALHTKTFERLKVKFQKLLEGR